MADDIDKISEGAKIPCPYVTCGKVFEDIDPSVAVAIKNNHIRKEHPNDEE